MTAVNKQTASIRFLQRFPFYSELEYEFFEERAGILEFEAKLPRRLAEQKAWQAVLELRRMEKVRKAS